MVNGEITKTDNPGLITSIVLTKLENGNLSTLSLNNLLLLLNFGIPDSLYKSLSDSYMLGIYSEPTNIQIPHAKHLFIILGISDYNLAYSGTLEWEKNLFKNMSIIFNIPMSERLTSKPWEDIIINNKDARVLYSDDGKSILYYTFIDKNNIVITDSKDVVKEIGVRLVAQNNKPL